MIRRLTTVLTLALLAAGCVMGPDYKRPEIPAPPQWRELPAEEAQALANTPWWELFDDPQLQELIRIALAENRDLLIATERIEEARARYGFTRADLYPKVDGSATVGHLHTSEGSLVHTPEEDLGGGDGGDTQLFAVSADVSWEIDFFGRVRRATESERALLLGTEEARRSVAMTLVAAVAESYFELRDFDRRLEIARRTIGSLQESLQLAKDRFEGGITSELDMRQADAELRGVEAVTFDLERLIAMKENELSVLLGRNPGAIVRGRPLEDQKRPGDVPAGLPAELLDRRPDIRVAEQNLAAATANIGEAKALLFPRIALTGSLGLSSTELDTLFEGESKAWSLIGQLLQPIFDAGRNKRRVEITESRQRQLLYNYERTILLAFQETEDALVAYSKTGEQHQAQAARVVAERKVLELAELRYRGGITAYLEVLDAQRSLFGAELDEAETLGSHLVWLVRLYKALGGGWPPDAEPAAQPPMDGR
ncbi:MAG TPA: efflux transporter outer membrane subunit [Thermoanaerobaculia bacterium]